MDTPPSVLPPGCSLRGQALHLDLACLAVKERPDSPVRAVVRTLDVARYYGLSVTLGEDPLRRAPSAIHERIASK